MVNTDVPRVTVELAALVDTKDEEHVLARPECLVEDTFVVPLRGPDALLNAEV
jgi:hypothetical protein